MVQDALPHTDYRAFARDLDALRAEIDRDLGVADLAHLQKMARWGRGCTALGYALGWIAPNPVSVIFLGLGTSARWTVVAHHVSHRAMDRIPAAPVAFTSKGFARGWRRLLDWNDWIDPEAWAHEHNVLHHYHTGEAGDPDLVEDQMRSVRDSRLPVLVKYLAVGFFALTWKLTYYAPNTMALLQRSRRRRAAGAPPDHGAPATDVSLFHQWDPRTEDGRAFWLRSVLPYGLTRFALAPALFAPLGPWAVFSVWANTVAAEAVSSVHTFMIIATNHCGDDVHRFDRPTTDRAEFYARQVLGSVNFTTGGDVRDFLHGFLNYQIEHHLWPDLPPRQYQRVAGRVKALCERHGVPYVQEPVLTRFRKMVDIMVGRTSMVRSSTRARSERTDAHAD